MKELRFVKNTEEEIIKAVESDGDALQYVKDQTEAICIKAVESDGDALQYVKDQTEAICIKAVERNGYALRYVKDQTEAICIKAVESDGDALQYVEIKSEEVYKIATSYKNEYGETFGFSIKKKSYTMSELKIMIGEDFDLEVSDNE